MLQVSFTTVPGGFAPVAALDTADTKSLTGQFAKEKVFDKISNLTFNRTSLVSVSVVMPTASPSTPSDYVCTITLSLPARWEHVHGFLHLKTFNFLQLVWLNVLLCGSMNEPLHL